MTINTPKPKPLEFDFRGQKIEAPELLALMEEEAKQAKAPAPRKAPEPAFLGWEVRGYSPQNVEFVRQNLEIGESFEGACRRLRVGKKRVHAPLQSEHAAQEIATLAAMAGWISIDVSKKT
ncbi:MAG: hypothetical protein ACRDAM_01895, partial [Casimicrobium sp.]